MSDSGFIEPVPIENESAAVRDLRDDIALAEMLCGNDPRGRKIIGRLKARLAVLLNTGTATDAAVVQPSGLDRLNAEYAKRVGKQIVVK
jgi:hypothetical protein